MEKQVVHKYSRLNTYLFSQTYRTVMGDHQRYQERIDEISSRPHKQAAEEPAIPIQSEPPGEQIDCLISVMIKL